MEGARVSWGHLYPGAALAAVTLTRAQTRAGRVPTRHHGPCGQHCSRCRAQEALGGSCPTADGGTVAEGPGTEGPLWGALTWVELGGRALTLQSSWLPGMTCTVSWTSGSASATSLSALSAPRSWNTPQPCGRGQGPGPPSGPAASPEWDALRHRTGHRARPVTCLSHS